MSYVDLHLHLLPGLDDGPRDVEESLDHARRMTRGCVREAVVTPHVGHPRMPVDIRAVAARTHALQAALDAATIPLRLHAGGEIHCSVAGSLSASELDLVAQGPEGARWVLLEPPFAGIDEEFVAACRAVRARGFAVVVAHPERAAGLMDGGLRLLEEEITAGTLLQVNVDSLLGDHGGEARNAARALIRGGLAHVVASDGHGAARPQTLADGFALAVGAGVTAGHAWRLTQANPAFLLRHGIPSGAPATPPVHPQRPWSPAHASRVAATQRERRRLAR